MQHFMNSSSNILTGRGKYGKVSPVEGCHCNLCRLSDASCSISSHPLRPIIFCRVSLCVCSAPVPEEKPKLRARACVQYILYWHASSEKNAVPSLRDLPVHGGIRCFRCSSSLSDPRTSNGETKSEETTKLLGLAFGIQGTWLASSASTASCTF